MEFAKRIPYRSRKTPCPRAVAQAERGVCISEAGVCCSHVISDWLYDLARCRMAFSVSTACWRTSLEMSGRSRS